MITIWQGITIQSLYCDLDMGTNKIMYYKCSHVPNLLRIDMGDTAWYVMAAVKRLLLNNC